MKIEYINEVKDWNEGLVKMHIDNNLNIDTLGDNQLDKQIKHVTYNTFHAIPNLLKEIKYRNGMDKRSENNEKLSRYYEQRRNITVTNCGLDLFQGLYGRNPQNTREDLDEVKRLADLTNTYMENKIAMSPYKEGDNRMRGFNRSEGSEEFETIQKFDELIKKDNNELSNNTLEAITNHVEKVVIGKVEEIIENKFNNIIDILSDKFESIYKETVKSLQTE